MPRCLALLAAAAALAPWAATAAGQTAPASAPAASASAPAPAPGPDEQAVWRRIWAYRAARAEAAVGLARQIEDLPLGAGAKVGDFLAESPPLQHALLAWLLGLEPAKPPTHTPAGLCELVLEVPEKDLVAALGEIHARHYTGRRFAAVDFAALARQGPIGFLRESAEAAAHPALVGPGLIERRGGREYFDRAAPAVRAYWQKHVTGAGRAAAEGRARQDALRRLGERIKDAAIDEQTRLADYVSAAGKGDVEMSRFLRAAREKGLRYQADAPIVEAEVEVSLRTVYACLRAWAMAEAPGRDMRQLERLIVAARGAMVRQGGIGCPDPEQVKTKDGGALRAIALAGSAPDWLGRSLRETGRAKPTRPGPDAADAAIRAAERAARAALARRLEELPVAATTVGKLAGQDPVARRALLTVLLDARPAAAPTVAKDGSAELTLELPLMSLWRLVLHWQREAPAPGE